MDVQNKWKLELGRMVTLCMQEAAEYERGRSLQVLQPSLAGLLQPSAATVANLQQPGRPGAVSDLMKVSGAITPQQDTGKHGGAAGSSRSIAAAPGDGLCSSVTSIKQEHPAPASGAQQQTPALSASTSQADPATTLPFCTPLSVLSGSEQAARIPMRAPASATAALTPAMVLGSGMSSQQMASMARMPQQQAQTGTTSTTEAADTAVATATPLQGHLAVSGLANVDTAAAITPALLLPGVSTPLMQQVLIQQRLQQQQQWQATNTANASKEPASKEAVITTTQPNARKGKRRGYCIQPEALKRLVAQQMQKKQQPPQQQEQPDPEQEHDQQPLPATSLQHQQLTARLHPQQQQQQRSMPQVVQDSASASAFAGIAEDSPGATVAALLPLQLPVLESPGSALGMSMTCAGELEQPSVQLELNASKLFGSAQKRLRLSICDEGNSSAAPHAQQLDLQLSQALTSPVAVPAATAARDAVAAAAAIAAGMPAMSAAAAAVELPPLPQGLVTPSKFFASSPGSAMGGGAVTAGSIPQPAFATPSKFFDCSPVSVGKVRAAQATPATPLLFGHGSASAWPKQLNMEAQPAAGPATAANSSSLLRSSTAPGAGAGSNSKAQNGVVAGEAEPSSWVPVDGHSRLNLSSAADLSLYAATPAGTAMKIGLMCTPMASGNASNVGVNGLDAAAAAAAPVETLPVKGSAGTGDAGTSGDNAAGAAAGPALLVTPAVTQQQLQATPVTGL